MSVTNILTKNTYKNFYFNFVLQPIALYHNQGNTISISCRKLTLQQDGIIIVFIRQQKELKVKKMPM